MDQGRHRRFQIALGQQSLKTSGRRSMPLPWRRSFGRPGSVPDHVILERKFRWRASIYDRQLRAVRIHSRSSLELEIKSSKNKRGNKTPATVPVLPKLFTSTFRIPKLKSPPSSGVI